MHNEILDVFEKKGDIERIKIVVKRRYETSKKISYDLYYALEDGSYILYAIA